MSKELRHIGFPSRNDIYLSTTDGATQINHVVRAGNAIIVIETKTFSGAAYGGPRDKTWHQSFRRGQNTSFRNPHHQNYKHVQAVRAALGPGADIRGIVVIAGDAKFPKGMSDGKVTTGEAGWNRLTEVVGEYVGRQEKALHRRTLEAKAGSIAR